MSKITLAQLCAMTRTHEKDVQNWLQRLRLMTRYARGKTGPARDGRFTRDNTVELFLISKLVRLGLAPAVAANHVGGLIRQWARGERPGLTIFVSESIAVPLDGPLTPEQVAEFQKEEIAFVIVDAAAAVAEVDNAFDWAADFNAVAKSAAPGRHRGDLRRRRRGHREHGSA